MHVYTAGPIDLGTDIKNWRQMLVDEMDKSGQLISVFDPSSAYKIAGLGKPDEQRDEYIETINAHALLSAAAMVVSLPAGVQSIGTPIEMHMAKQDWNVPIILLTDIPYGKSVYLNRLVKVDNWIYVDDLKDQAKVSDGISQVVQLLSMMDYQTI